MPLVYLYVVDMVDRRLLVVVERGCWQIVIVKFFGKEKIT